MGKTVYQKVTELLRDLREKNGELVEEKVFSDELKKRIGSDSRTKRRVMEVINDLKLADNAANGMVRINGNT